MHKEEGRVCVQIACIPFFFLGCLPEIYFCVGRPELFPIFYSSKLLFFSFKILSFSPKHKLHLLDPPV